MAALAGFSLERVGKHRREPGSVTCPPPTCGPAASPRLRLRSSVTAQSGARLLWVALKAACVCQAGGGFPSRPSHYSLFSLTSYLVFYSYLTLSKDVPVSSCCDLPSAAGKGSAPREGP